MVNKPLLIRIEQEFKDALKNQELLKLSVLRLLKTALKNFQIEKRTKGETDQLTDDEIIKVIKKEIKKREEAIVSFQQGERPDLVEKEQKELIILKDFVPADLTDEEIKKIINQIITENNLSPAKDFGQIMKLVMVGVGSRADGKRVSLLVKEQISS